MRLLGEAGFACFVEDFRDLRIWETRGFRLGIGRQLLVGMGLVQHLVLEDWTKFGLQSVYVADGFRPVQPTFMLQTSVGSCTLAWVVGHVWYMTT